MEDVQMGVSSVFKLTNEIPSSHNLATGERRPTTSPEAFYTFHFISGTLPTEVHNTASALRFEKTGCPSEEATMWYKQHSNQPGVEKLTGAAARRAAGAPVLPQLCSQLLKQQPGFFPPVCHHLRPSPQETHIHDWLARVCWGFSVNVSNTSLVCKAPAVSKIISLTAARFSVTSCLSHLSSSGFFFLFFSSAYYCYFLVSWQQKTQLAWIWLVNEFCPNIL